MSRPFLLIIFLLLTPLSLLAGVAFGSVDLSLSEVMCALAGKEAGLATDIVWQLRLPRVASAFACGGLLALAGSLLQALLRNPLADPFVLGVSTGASLGTILYSILAASWGTVQATSGALYGRPLAAFAGAALVIGAVYFVAGGRTRSGEASQRLLLAGIVLASFISSINVILLTSTNQADLRGIFYWLIGDLSRPVDASIYVVCFIVLVGALLLSTHARSLNLIAMGEEDAMILGVEVARVKVAAYLVASLITGAVVSISGPIAYIGLICPHLGRMMFGNDNRILFPAVFLFGAIFTLLADTAARTLLSPAELPVGVITALIGAPMFIYLSRRRSGL